MTATYPVWGWGTSADECPTPGDLTALAPLVADVLELSPSPPELPAALGPLPADRVSARLPPSLRPLASDDALDRARHGLGRSYRDVVRGLRGQIDHAPDVVLRPRDESDVTATLDWCASHAVAVVPFGGGTSVSGGVEPDCGGDMAGIVSLDLSGLSGVVEVDVTSRAARVRGGTTGPDLEAALRGQALTARFYPQSFERSTVGGWVATRAAGHFSTGPTHIDDLVESVRAVTPAGPWESARVPASGAGPSPDAMLLGSEGVLGVVTETWLRVQPRPADRWSALLAAPDFAAGADAVRRLVQDGVALSACRVVDADEARLSGTLTTGETAVVLGLESLGPPLETTAAHVLARCAEVGLRTAEAGRRGSGGESWRQSFLRAPYLREQLVMLGVFVETFETATTWDRLPGLVAAVSTAARSALGTAAARVTCRLTHAYPDGAAPYFTVLAEARRGDELKQWQDVKEAVTDAVAAAGGTVTHHHAVGRDARRWYDAQRPALFASSLSAVKRVVDPAGVMNPGVLIDSAGERVRDRRG